MCACVFDRCLPLLSAWDAGAYPLSLQLFSEPISVVATIPELPIDVWQAAMQVARADVIADLSGGNEQVDRSSLTVADCVQLGVHAAWFDRSDD